MKETLAPVPPSPPVVGSVRIEKRMLKFLIRRENLDLNNPVLDLSKPSVIREVLTLFLRTEEELKNDNVATFLRRERLTFIPRQKYQKEMRIFLDANGTHHFNRFLHRQFEELLFEHIGNCVLFTGKSALYGVESFLNQHRLTVDDFPDVEFEHETLVKANYRLRKVRNLVQRDMFLPAPIEL